jgi:ParB family chromosome partitioning protein
MSAAKNSHGLGRGFESLIPTDLLDESFDPTAAQDERVSDLRQIKLSEIIADPDQPRRSFDEAALAELTASVKEHGVLQPIVVTPHGSGYQIVAGERRYRASRAAGLDKIPALVRTLSGQHKLELSLIENLQRRDLNAIETATAYAKLRDQFNLSLEKIGSRVGGKSVSAISNTLRLLKLPTEARTAVAEGKLTEGQARPLVGADETLVSQLLPKMITENWSARQVERYLAEAREKGDTPRQRTVNTSVYEKETTHFRQRFGDSVKIRASGKGAGQVIIPFKDEDDLKRLESLL